MPALQWAVVKAFAFYWTGYRITYLLAPAQTSHILHRRKTGKLLCLSIKTFLNGCRAHGFYVNKSKRKWFFNYLIYQRKRVLLIYIVTKCEKVRSRYKWFMYLKRGWNLKLHTISGFIDASSLHSVSVEHDNISKLINFLNKTLFSSF